MTYDFTSTAFFCFAATGVFPLLYLLVRVPTIVY